MRKIGRYRIARELGRGAMGVVYHAIDPTIGRPVAIKTLRWRDVDDAEQRLRLRERLFREARSAGALSHPGIVTIYDMDEVDGLAYIAMEYVDGETLEAILARHQGLTRERMGEILLQAAAALDYAHRKGIIHRDIKPANIMIDTTGAVKITDFGIAKITRIEGRTLTGALVGTPNYMSPEQVQGHEIDGRSDQFSLGVIAYEMLTGERPFYGEQISTVIYKIVADQPVPARNINTTLNEPVDKVLQRGLGKKPERRFSSCTAFVTALMGALGGAKSWRILPRQAHQNIPAVSAGASAKSFKPIRKPAAGALGPPNSSAARKRSWLLPFFAAFLFLLALLAAVAWQAGLLDIPWASAVIRDLSPTGTPPQPRNTEPEVKPEPIPTEPAAASPERPKAEPASEIEQAKAAPAPDPNATFQEVQVMTDPAEAAAMLDGLRDAACRTPCKLRARTGIHTLIATKEGYQPESREVRVDHEDFEVPLITLRSANGILLLTSDPTAAHVWLDGKPTDFVTPVRISLTAGKHSVSIQKDSLQTSDRIEIHNGALSTLKLTVRPQ